MIKRTVRIVNQPKKRADIERREDACILNANRRIGMILAAVLYDKFDFKIKKISNAYHCIEKLKWEWQEGRTTSAMLITYCRKKDIDIVQVVRNIPMSQKLHLATVTPDGKKKAPVPSIDTGKMVDSAIIATLGIVIPVMKERYRFSNANIKKLIKWIVYYIDSYATNYVNDEIVLGQFILDEHINLITGEPATEEEIYKATYGAA